MILDIEIDADNFEDYRKYETEVNKRETTMNPQVRFFRAIARKDRLEAIKELRAALRSEGLDVDLHTAIAIVGNAMQATPWEPPTETEIDVR